MKNRFYNRIMGPAVLIIWGLIAWRMLAPEQAPSDLIQPVTSVEVSGMVSPDAKPPDLNLNYRDPFLDQLPQRQAPAMRTTSAARSPHITRIVAKPVITYPKVTYLGGVRGNGGVTGLVSVNKQFAQVVSGDTIARLRVLDLSLKDITVAFEDSIWKVSQR